MLDNISYTSLPISSAEPDPNFKFVKNLPKHTDGFLTEEVVLECQVNSHKAIVHWYKGEDQVEVSGAARSLD